MGAKYVPTALRQAWLNESARSCNTSSDNAMQYASRSTVLQHFWLGVRIPAGAGYFSLSETSRPALRLTRPPIPWILSRGQSG